MIQLLLDAVRFVFTSILGLIFIIFCIHMYGVATDVFTFSQWFNYGLFLRHSSFYLWNGFFKKHCSTSCYFIFKLNNFVYISLVKFQTIISTLKLYNSISINNFYKLYVFELKIQIVLNFLCIY